MPKETTGRKNKSRSSARKNVNEVQRGSDLLRMMMVDDAAVTSASTPGRFTAHGAV